MGKNERRKKEKAKKNWDYFDNELPRKIKAGWKFNKTDLHLMADILRRQYQQKDEFILSVLNEANKYLEEPISDFNLKRIVSDLPKIVVHDWEKGVTAHTLYYDDIPKPREIIPGFLVEGLTFLAGKPKVGKSWMALQIAISIASGGKVLSRFDTDEGDVLLIALEDRLGRLKDRLHKMLMGGEEPPQRLRFVIDWKKSNNGGLDEIRSWVRAHPQAKIVIIDTLQRFRGSSQKRNGNIYAEDYDLVSSIKKIADEFHIAILVVHHVRKGQDEDLVESVNGTYGVTGGADGIWVLDKKRKTKKAELFTTGRDVEEVGYAVQQNPTTMCWDITGLSDDIGLTELQEEVLKIIKNDRTISAVSIARHLNKDDGNIRKVIKSLENKEILVKHEGIWMINRNLE